MFVTNFYEVNESVLIFHYMYDTGSIDAILFLLYVYNTDYLSCILNNISLKNV